MRDWVDVGPVPSLEVSVRVVNAGAEASARNEAEVFVALLRRRFGREPDGAELEVVTLDFGTRRSVTVLCFFDTDLPESEAYARRCAKDCPQYWDAAALEELSRGPT